MANLARRITVVVADDTADIRDLVNISLDVDGRFDVVGEAADGRAAIEECRRLQPDAIVLDLDMPVLSGERALPLIRDMAPMTAVVVYSAYYTAELRARLLERGATAVVSKSARPADLADVVAHAVRDARPD